MRNAQRQSDDNMRHLDPGRSAESDYERDFKTTSEHWDIIVNYPMLLKSKFGGFDGDNAKIKELWEEMVGILNSLGYGQRSVQKWKEAIGRWKSKVKAKGRRQSQEMTTTGGGPVKTVPLTQTEEKLMSILGWKAVTGDSNKELGLVATNSKVIEQSMNNASTLASVTASSTFVHPCTSTEIVPELSVTQYLATEEVTQLSFNDKNFNAREVIPQKAETISVLSEPSTASKSLGTTLLTTIPPPLVLLKKGTTNGDKKEFSPLVLSKKQIVNGDKEEPSPSVLSKKRIANGDKENYSFMQKKKKIITSSEKSQRYITLIAMHGEQTNILNDINLNIKNASYQLKQIASNINQLVNHFITKERTENEFESIEFLDDNLNVTE